MVKDNYDEDTPSPEYIAYIDSISKKIITTFIALALFLIIFNIIRKQYFPKLRLFKRFY